MIGPGDDKWSPKHHLGVLKDTYRTREGSGMEVKVHMGNQLVHYIVVMAVSNEIQECVINKMGIHLYTHHYRLW